VSWLATRGSIKSVIWQEWKNSFPRRGKTDCEYKKAALRRLF